MRLLMDGENYNCVDWCEARTSLEDYGEAFTQPTCGKATAR